MRTRQGLTTAEVTGVSRNSGTRRIREAPIKYRRTLEESRGY